MDDVLKRQALKIFKDTFCMVMCGHYCTHKKCITCDVKIMTVDTWSLIRLRDLLEVKHAK